MSGHYQCNESFVVSIKLTLSFTFLCLPKRAHLQVCVPWYLNALDDPKDIAGWLVSLENNCYLENGLGNLENCQNSQKNMEKVWKK